jgi:hypothetical protein
MRKISRYSCLSIRNIPMKANCCSCSKEATTILYIKTFFVSGHFHLCEECANMFNAGELLL